MAGHRAEEPPQRSPASCLTLSPFTYEPEEFPNPLDSGRSVAPYRGTYIP
jgi:hypothetical protein